MDQTSWWTKVTSVLRGGSAAANKRAAATKGNHSNPAVLRLVIDTNIFIAAVRAPHSSSRQLLDAIGQGRATLLVSQPVFNEYRRILSKAVGSGEREQTIRQWIARAETVDATRGPRVVPDDPDDDKFVELARIGKADAIVLNDSHLLDIVGDIGVRVLRPGEALRELA